MAFRLAVDNKVGVTIKGKQRDASGSEKDFEFVLVCDRLEQAQLQAQMTDGKTTVDFFAEHARDWQRQALVVDDSGAPAPFSSEALAVLMTLPGMANLCWHSYLQQVGASAKN